MSPKFTLLAFSLLLSISCNAQPLQDRLASIVDSIYRANQDAVGIIVHLEAPNLKQSWSYAVGYSDKVSQAPLQAEQPVLIASNTKTYVAAAILKLADQGKLSLDQPIKKVVKKPTKRLLKKSGYDLEKITIRHLLSHTSGITDYVTDDYFAFVDRNPQYQWTRDEQIQLAAQLAEPKAPGKSFAYGDINYLLLTEIIERKTKKAFYLAMRELLGFSKHQLAATWFETLEETPADLLPLATQYSSKFKGSSRDLNPAWDLYGGGGLAATAADLSAFFQLLFTEQIIEDAQLLSELYTYVIPKEESRNYCLGLYNLPSFFGQNAYYHGGFWGTDAMYIPSLNATITVFTLVREKRGLNPGLANEIMKAISQ